MMRGLEPPAARAASTNSFSLSESTCPRTTRAMYIHPRPASTKMMTEVWSKPELWKYLMATASTAMAGTTKNRSVSRINNWSQARPK